MKNRKSKLESGAPGVFSVACLGPEGTFSHMLALKRFGADASISALGDLGEVFEWVAGHPGSVGLVPVENSSGGTISDTVDLLIKHAGQIRVLEDIALDVRLGLLGRAGANVRAVYSHFAPLRHHRDWLLNRFPGVHLHPVSSTAEAARRASKSRDSAALASPTAAALYGLDVLEFPVRPEAVNVTRFYVVRSSAFECELSAQETGAEAPGGARKTSLVVRLKNECGSLFRFLEPFARCGVNLRMIVSRPVPGSPETYVFFVELEGAPQSGPLAMALENAADSCELIQVLGPFASGGKIVS